MYTFFIMAGYSQRSRACRDPESPVTRKAMTRIRSMTRMAITRTRLRRISGSRDTPDILIRVFGYPSLGLSESWVIRVLGYPSLGLSETWPRAGPGPDD